MHITTNLVDLNWWSFALSSVLHPLITILLCLLSVFVVLGNLLVVSAIWHENQLHSVTNYLIASLAAADCLVGAVVMPFSIISEVILESWTFGATWCDLWHSFDVLASTASIMNLCAISLDRYLAITDPISYPARMTPKRVALIIVFLWTCSSLISFPAILWWRAVGQGPLQQFATTISPLPSEFLISATANSEPEEPLYKCMFTDDTYYLLCSSFISFYGPLCVMLYAYYRIYKAAVQQTRFLKHGSKQVMIGRNKKLKRSKHASEQSVHSSNDKTGPNGASCDGLSTMESYDRQHLVLRAHRGGGGNSSLMSKAGNGEISNKTNDKRRKDLNHESFVSKISFDTDQESKKGSQLTSHHTDENEQSILYKTDMPKVLIKGLNRKDRIALSSSKRDKLRMDSQRFDSKQQENVQGAGEGSGRMNNHLNLVNSFCSSDCKSELTTDSEVDERLIENCNKKDNEQTRQVTCNNVTHYEQTMGKPLIASISNRSTSVDASIVKMPRSFDINADKPQQTFNLSTTRNSKCERGNQKDSRFINGSQKEAEEKNNWYSIEVDDEISDEIVESDSDNTNSGSYGTGSIVSVMVRPQQTQENSDEKYNSNSNININNNKNEICDSSGGQTGDPKLRRALSFGEARHTELAPMLRIDETTANIEPASDATFNSSRYSRQKHRASCSDPFVKASDLVAFKTAKALNIKSWVKLTRQRPRKNSCSQSIKPVKPPPSLMPLMMMNSDTSTDSSTVIGTIKRADEKPEESDTNGCTTYKLEQVNIRSSGYQHKNNEQRLQEKPALRRNKIENSLEENQTDKNLSFKDDLERGEARGKGQVLYYDSDKLIQSIVDLTAIHYIDCSNKSAKNIGKTTAAATAAATTTTKVTNETEKMNSEQSDQTHITDSARTNVPRQHGKVGRKLSKLAKERKAAKTLGIVVGVFILCWLPFFVVNIVVALCGTNCIYKFEIFSSVVTWLGWLNSAMNPVIYACWSRDFRRAFRRVLCRCISWFLIRSRVSRRNG